MNYKLSPKPSIRKTCKYSNWKISHSKIKNYKSKMQIKRNKFKDNHNKINELHLNIKSLTNHTFNWQETLKKFSKILTFKSTDLSHFKDNTPQIMIHCKESNNKLTN